MFKSLTQSPKMCQLFAELRQTVLHWRHSHSSVQSDSAPLTSAMRTAPSLRLQIDRLYVDKHTARKSKTSIFHPIILFVNTFMS